MRPGQDEFDFLCDLQGLCRLLIGNHEIIVVCYYQPKISLWAKAAWERIAAWESEYYPGVTRVVVRCTRSEYDREEKNPYASGVVWEEVPEITQRI
ncbi:MAG: hypothetical protein M3Q81_00405 [bacterium]|nr:hypothetical protein [bacterium]